MDKIDEIPEESLVEYFPTVNLNFAGKLTRITRCKDCPKRIRKKVVYTYENSEGKFKIIKEE